MEKSGPLVSILCSCFNHEKFVETALDSVLNQTYRNIELYIIDDYSSDNSIQVIEKWIKKNDFGILIKNKKNLGLTKSFNNALKKTKGAYLVDLSADDELLPSFTETLLHVFESYQEQPVGIVYGNTFVTDYEKNNTYTYFFERFNQKKKTITPPDGFVYKELIDQSNNVCSVSAMMKRSVFEKLGGYDENLIYEDYDYWIRTARDHHILYVDKIIVNRFTLKNSLGSNIHIEFNKKNYRFKKSTYLTLKKTLKLNRTKEEDQASIRKILFETKNNARIFNISLCLKYLVLLSRFILKK